MDRILGLTQFSLLRVKYTFASFSYFSCNFLSLIYSFVCLQGQWKFLQNCKTINFHMLFILQNSLQWRQICKIKWQQKYVALIKTFAFLKHQNSFIFKEVINGHLKWKGISSSPAQSSVHYNGYRYVDWRRPRDGSRHLMGQDKWFYNLAYLPSNSGKGKPQIKWQLK